MNTEPRVSVVLPTYNRETLVARAIDSVLAQTQADFELIVVDDASTDGTRAVLERYRNDSRVRLILLEENCGGGQARNVGIEAARGALIAFQDSDDVWLPHKLAAQVEALDALPEIGLCYCGSVFSEGRRTYYIPSNRFQSLEGDMSREVLRSNPTSTQTLMVRRETLDRAGYFDPGLKRFQDWDLVIRLAQITRFAFLPTPMVVIFATPGNISSVAANDTIARATILEKYADIFATYPQQGAKQHYTQARNLQRLGQGELARKHLRRALGLKLRSIRQPTS